MLQLGTSKVDITPPFAVPLAGFSGRTGVFARVLDPLFARVFCFQPPASAPVVLVSADVIWWGNDRIDALRRRIRSLSGLEHAAIVLHATHNHSGPQTSQALSPSIGEASPAYLELLEDSLVDGVREAFGACEPVTPERGLGHCGIGVHRRRMRDGQIHMAPDTEGANDSECTVVRFRREDGSTKSVLVHFTCHPTTTAENSLSAEFCGSAMTTIESEFGKGVVAGFLQGCCGDIRPALVRNGEFYRGNAADVRRLGSELADVCLAVLSRPMQECEPALCCVSTIAVPLLFQTNDSPVLLELTRITLARGLGVLFFNAEMVVEYGLLVKQRSNGAVLPVAYSNGMLGYVTTERQLAEGGYESREAFRYFAMPGPFAATTELRVREAINALLL